MYRQLWKIHSWLGLIAGLGLVAIGLSGSLLVFHADIERWVNPELIAVQPTEAGRLPFDALLKAANEQIATHEVTGWAIQSERADLADILYLIERGTNVWQMATINPYSGEILASPRSYRESFGGWMLEFHSTFLADHLGMWVTGILGLMLCILGVTGLWLYRDLASHFLTLRWGRGLRILLSDTHKFLGATSVLFNLLLGATGLYWNVEHLVSEWGMSDEDAPKVTQRLYSDSLSLDELLRDAAGRLIGFHTNFISLPQAPGGEIVLYGTVEPRSSLQGLHGSTVSYNGQTLAHTSVSDLRGRGLWARVVDAFEPLHYGTFGGFFTKLLWVLGGLAPGALALTGTAIWWSRRRHPRKA